MTDTTREPRHSAAAHIVAEYLWEIFDEVRALEREDIERIARHRRVDGNHDLGAGALAEAR